MLIHVRPLTLEFLLVSCVVEPQGLSHDYEDTAYPKHTCHMHITVEDEVDKAVNRRL